MRATKLRKLLAAKLTLLCVLVWSFHLSATVMVYVDLARLAELADVVVQGRVVDQHTYMDDVSGNIQTDTTLEVTKNFFGATSETITISQYGGEFDGRLAKIPGDATFDPYENVVVFLNRGPQENGKLYLTALGQSKFKIHNDGKTVRAIRDLSGLSFIDQQTQKFESKQIEIVEYRAFVTELKSLIETAKGGAK